MKIVQVLSPVNAITRSVCLSRLAPRNISTLRTFAQHLQGHHQ